MGVVLQTDSGIQVCDCDMSTINPYLDLLEPEPCPDPERDYEDARSENVQVLQGQLRVHHCSVRVTTRVTGRGLDSLT